ncbi:MAG TPA: FAD binding domain-containing protein [Xanthobacteraceae bacterium]|jgi:2-polyprenyl-6-methoxyphenol hydroxylase-like FAD-dependent oxidoreductase
MRKAQTRRAVVVGGSMSGLLAGLLLRRADWDVEIYERVEGELAGRGAGIVAQPDLIEALGRIGIDTRDLGVEIGTRKILDGSGRVIGESTCPQVLTAWERVYRALRDAFPPGRYHRGRTVSSVDPTENAVLAKLGEHGAIACDLLVGADGLRSTVRQQCLPDLLPLYVGYVAWRALIPEAAFPAAIHRQLFNYMTFYLPPGEQFLGYPVAGPENDLRPGHRRYNVVWYRPADETSELRSLLTDEAGTTHPVSIPPPLIRRDAISAMRTDAERLLPPQFCDVVRMISEPILQPIYDLATPRMAFGRVAIVGDAAFVARPHVAAGVAKAADDAACLVAALEQNENVEEALKNFEAQRLPVGHRIIERARHLGAYLQATQTAQDRLRSQRHGIPQAVLAETAVLDFLRV